jgi:hypothetical protein
MKRKATSGASQGPEFIVRREAFDRYFDHPIPSSTFFDLVDDGKILAWPQMRGRYYLNRSLKKLGLPTVTKLPEPVRKRSLEDIARLAFTLLDAIVFPAPPWLLTEEAIDATTADHAGRMANQYREKVEACESIEEKLAYFAGVLDAQVLIEAEQRS